MRKVTSGWCMPLKVGMVGVLSSVQVEVGLDTCDESDTDEDEQLESEEADRILGWPLRGMGAVKSR